MTEAAYGAPSNLERILWRVVLVLLLIGATLSIWAALGGQLGPLQVKLLVSSFGIAVYVAIALGCAAVLKRQPTSLGSRAGLVACAVGGVVFVAGVWTNVSNHIWWWKALGITFLLGVACAHASWLLVFNLADRFQMVRTITRVGIYGYALILCAMMAFNIDNLMLWRAVAVLSTLAMFGTAAMPVLSRLSVNDERK